MSREAIFKLGDVVTLKSGGPAMTIIYIHDYDQEFVGTYDCTWFEGSKLYKETFIEEALIKYVEVTGIF